MKTKIKRPIVHYLIIIGYIAAPAANILQLMVLHGIPFLTIMQRLFKGYGVLASFWLLTAPLVGISLLFVHRAVWFVFIGHSSLILIDYVLKWVIRPAFYWQTIPTFQNFLIFTGNLLLVGVIGYIIQKDFRAPYFQALKRSWRENERVPIRHDIRLNDQKADVDDLSDSGCFVPHPELNLDIGDKVSVHFTGYSRPIECRAEIMRVTSNGYGVRFLSLSSANRNDIKKLIKRRHYLRYAIDMEATFTYSKKALKTKMLDISGGGCFLQTDISEIQRGIDGKVDLSINGRRHNVEGKIVWVNEKQRSDLPAGFGVRFLRSHKRIIKHLKKRYGTLMQVR